MANSMRSAAAACQVNTDSRVEGCEGKMVSLELLREAIAESRWKHEALAAEMRLPNAAYLSRMLSGEKPCTLRHLESLPDDIEAIYYRLRAESLGLFVVTPASDDSAVQHFVGGLLTLLRPQLLPDRASGMAKASLPADVARKVSR